MPPSHLGTRTPRSVGRRVPGPSRTLSAGLVERVPARARALRSRVVDREAGGLERVDEVDRRLGHVRDAHLVHDDPDAVLLLGDVLVRELVVQVHRVAKTGAPARLDGHPKRDVRASLLDEELLDLAGGVLGELDHRPSVGGWESGPWILPAPGRSSTGEVRFPSGRPPRPG